MPPTPRTTRLAPSPTGALHLGNARTFLINWALARPQGWRIVLRIEDLDGPRVKPGADTQAVTDLRWLGLDWDGWPTPDSPPLYQRADLAPYHRALEGLRRAGLIYPCTCTRKDLERAQSAPHAEDHELRYPGTCRDRAKGQGPGANGPDAPSELGPWPSALPGVGPDSAAWRLLVPDEDITFTDELAGPQRVNVQQQVGDFIVATKAGVPAYQLAVVVDDARQGVTDILRGDDLLRSTARQILLYRLLGLDALHGLPRYWHVPLVLGPDGRRLAKRHGDTRIAWYRDQGVPAARIVGLLAAWCGLVDHPTPMSAAEFRAGFDLGRLPRSPVTFTPEHHAWLLQRP